MLNAPAHTAPKASGMGAKEKKTAMPASELSVASHERRQQAAPLDIGLAANLASASTSNEKDQLAGKPWYIVMPDDAIVKGRDLFVVVALLCLAMVTPWELAFARAAGGVDFLFCFNRGIDCAFVFDILIQFFISRELVEPPQDIGVKKATPLEKFERQKQLLGTGRPRTYYDFRIKSIAWSYLTGMFLFDLLAMLPSVFDVVEVVTYYMTLGEDSDDSNLSLLRGSKAAKLAKMTSSSKMMKMMRISRVMKLVRLLNSFEKLKEIEMQLLNYLYEHKRKVLTPALPPPTPAPALPPPTPALGRTCLPPRSPRSSTPHAGSAASTHARAPSLPSPRPKGRTLSHPATASLPPPGPPN